MALIKLTKNTTNNKEVVKKEKIEKKIKKEKKFDDPKVIYEDERGKDEYTSHYVLNDGTKKTVISSVPVNYYDEQSNTWEEIDNTLEEENDSFVTKKRKFKTEINKTSKGKGVRLSNNKCNVSWHYLGKKNSKTVVENTKLTVNKFDSNNKKRNKNIYENVDVNTDLEYVLEGNNIKENIIVKEKSDSYEYNFLFELKGLKVRLSEDKESIEIYNDEKVEFLIPAPFMYDANGSRNDNVYYEIEENGVDKYLFTVIADKDWINSEERVLPVTIDPQIVVSSNEVITHQVQRRTISSTSSGLNYGQWQNETSSFVRVYKTDTFEYRTIINIKKTLINQLIADLSNANLIFVPKNNFSTSLYVDEKEYDFDSSMGLLIIDITNKFLKSSSDFTITLSANISNVDSCFFTTNNSTVLEINYVNNEHINHVTKSFNLAGIATGKLNLVTGEFSTFFTDVAGKNSVFSLPIYHINKKSIDNHLVGNNMRLSLHEKLINNDNFNYVYEDGFGNKHLFKPYYYYFDSKNIKIYILDTSEIIVETDKTMKIEIDSKFYVVNVEYKSTTGLEAFTSINDIKHMNYLEQRTKDIKQLEEQIQTYKDTLGEYVIFNIAARNIVPNKYLYNYLNSIKKFEEFYLWAEDELYYVPLIRSEAYSYIQLDINYRDEDVSDEIKELYNLQFSIITDGKVRLQKLHQLKTLFSEYCLKLEELEKLKLETPINFLTDGNIVKGYNSNGDLVTVFDKYNNYSNIVFEQYFASDNEKKYRISYLEDSLSNVVRLYYRSDNLLNSIVDNNGNIVKYYYENGELSKIKYDSGEVVLLTYTNGCVYTIIEEKNALKSIIYYGLNTPVYINNYSLVNNFNAYNHDEAIKLISKIQILRNPSSELPVRNVTIISDLVKEKYCFNSNGFNVEYYLEENGVVTKAEMYQYTPYWIGNEPQVDPKRIIINAYKSTLNSSNLESYVFITGDTVTTTINQFNKPITKTTSDIKISDTLTQNTIINYTYNDNQKLIEEYTVKKYKTTDGNVIKTVSTVKKYNYNLMGSVVRVETYVEGEELSNGKTIEETVYDEKGYTIKQFSYNSLDPSTKFYNESLYNERGQVVSKLDSLGVNTTKYRYLNNLLCEEILPNGSRFGYGYDHSGNLISITQSTIEGEENSNQKVIKYGEIVALNSNNNHIEYTYDYRGRVTNVNLDGSDNYITTTYQETKNSNEAVTEVNETTLYKYGVMNKKYDYKGRVVASGNEQLRVEYTYSHGDMLKKIYDNQQLINIDYTYDNYKRVLSVNETDNSSNLICGEIYNYNDYGLLIKKNISTYHIGSGNNNHEYRYEYNGDSKVNLNTIIFNTNTKINLKYDVNGRGKGRVFSIGNKVILDEEISYLKIGDHATLIPSAIKYIGTSDNLRYSYDNMGNINKVYVNGELAVRYTYDALNRLIREDNKVLKKTYLISYDNNGNIINKREFNYTLKDYNDLDEEDCKKNLNYVYNRDKLISINDEIVCEYDESTGQLLRYKGEGVSWKYDKISSVGQTYIYYDNFGRRESIGMLSFIYDSNNRIIKQNNGLEFFYDNNGVAGFIYDSDIYIYRKNILGDITDIIDKNGNIIVKYVYDAWGNHKVCNPDGTENIEYLFVGNLNPFRYRGYYYDVETQLFYCNSRYYSPELCRWISPDSIEYLDPQNINGLNLYCYCYNNPISYSDPSGNLPFFILTAIIGAVIGVGITAAVDYIPDKEFDLHWGWYVFGGAIGALVGAGIGMGISYSSTGTFTADVRWISAFNKASKGDYSKLVKLSTHNSKSNYVSLGRYYNKMSPKNYINIAKKNNFTYFDMGKYYDVASKKNIAYKINELFIKEQHSLGKIFYKTSLDVGGVYKWELEILRGLGAIAVPF